jgi:hypothetical protein
MLAIPILPGSFGIATGYGLDGMGSSAGRNKGVLSSPQRPDEVDFFKLPNLSSPGVDSASEKNEYLEFSGG